MKWLLKLFGKYNSGHRLSFELGPFPENSMEALNKGIQFQDRKDFKYWEFDIVESYDGGLFCFHDVVAGKTIKRMCPTSPYRGHNITDLPSHMIKDLRLLDTDCKIPKFEDVIDRLVEIATKPVNVEIKSVRSDIAQYLLLQKVREANEKGKVEFYFSIGKSKFKKMPNNRDFMRKCGEAGIRLEVM